MPARQCADKSPRAGLRWTPIVLTIAAGSLAFFGVRAMQPAGKPQHNGAVGRQVGLWQQLGRPSQPWTQELPGNRRERRFNADRTRAVLRVYQGDQQISESEFELAR